MEPPPPRHRPDVDVVCAALDASEPPLDWSTVTAAELSGAWVGVCPAVGGFGRWLWDVVEPELGVSDPLVLTVPQDLVQVSIGLGGSSFAVSFAVRSVPHDLELPASALPGWPWQVGWASGWTTSALHAAAQRWLDVQGVAAVLRAPQVAAGDGSVAVGELLRADAGAFDRLLASDPREAAVVTRFFDAVLGCLADRDLI